MVKNIALVSYHLQTFQIQCSESDCKQHNYADPNSPKPCPHQTSQQHQQIVPPSNAQPADYETYIVGNATSHVPSNKPGTNINPKRNYSNQSNLQDAIIESTPVTIDSQDIQVDTQNSQYFQEPNHHQRISNNSSAKHSNPKIP